MPRAEAVEAADSALEGAATEAGETADAIAETVTDTADAASRDPRRGDAGARGLGGRGGAGGDGAGRGEAPGTPLGAVGWDSEGRQGRIHVVVPGDTLWDISNAYLGTPWVWPSIWNDNGDIENPHEIYPQDRIWITPTEMRKLTAEEAEAFLAGEPPVPAAPEEDVWEEPTPAVPP